MDEQQGFVLIELLVVIAVLGLLASAVVIAVSKATEVAKPTACNTEKHVILTALDADRLDNQYGQYPPVSGSDGLDALRVDGYLGWQPKSVYWRYAQPPLLGDITAMDLVRVNTTEVPAATCLL